MTPDEHLDRALSSLDDVFGILSDDPKLKEIHNLKHRVEAGFRRVLREFRAYLAMREDEATKQQLLTELRNLALTCESTGYLLP